MKPLIASSDYEGIVTVWDVNTRQVREGHGVIFEYVRKQVVFYCQG